MNTPRTQTPRARQELRRPRPAPRADLEASAPSSRASVSLASLRAASLSSVSDAASVALAPPSGLTAAASGARTAAASGARTAAASGARSMALGRVSEVEMTPARGTSLAALRGYRTEDLYAVAEVGYHYLFAGGVEVAKALFEGLAAVAPTEAYFALALGLTHDHAGDLVAAERWYTKAAELDPSDGRADVNRAELCLERGDRVTARALLLRGAEKARQQKDAPLHRKATALVAHLDRHSPVRLR